MKNKMTEQEVQDMMVQKISDAIHPVLIPFEEQSWTEQVENRKVIDNISTMVWKEFLEQFKS